MNILVTGANGFIGRNLMLALQNAGYASLYAFDKDTEPALLDEYCAKADFVFHLAGINRPKEEKEFLEGNVDFASQLLDCLKKHHNTCPVMVSSSIQAELDNPYGKSKKMGEELFFRYAQETGAKSYIYRFHNVFGKWCAPNYNSVIATFCHNIAMGLPITVHDRDKVLNLVYIDDVMDEMLAALQGQATAMGAFYRVPVLHSVTLGAIADLLYAFHDSRGNLMVPDMSDPFVKKLYSTYLSYLPEDQFRYPLTMHTDPRGSFTEFLKTPDRGQVSVNISRPGIVKGNHWHHTKTEKFLVVSGRGVIRFRKPGCEKSIAYHVSGDKLEVVDIPPGYTHNIENTGDTDMVTVMWANESFDPERPDTWYLEVQASEST